MNCTIIIYLYCYCINIFLLYYYCNNNNNGIDSDTDDSTCRRNYCKLLTDIWLILGVLIPIFVFMIDDGLLEPFMQIKLPGHLHSLCNLVIFYKSLFYRSRCAVNSDAINMH